MNLSLNVKAKQTHDLSLAVWELIGFAAQQHSAKMTVHISSCESSVEDSNSGTIG